MERYRRQILLKNFGETAQGKLLSAKVLVIGAGGLGCPALQYLAGAGTGTIGIADDDRVSLAVLHRQVLFSVDDIGKNKAFAAKERLAQLNPEITIDTIPERIDTTNALDIISKYDYVLDGTDNFPSRYLVNDACVLLNKPLIYGAVSQYEGQVAVLNVEDLNGVKVNYRDIFPVAPQEGEVQNCSEAGVLGVLPGVIGVMQAAELIKLITGIGGSLVNRLLTYHALTQETYILDLIKNPASQEFMPENEAALINRCYDAFCGIDRKREIDILVLEQLIDQATIVDVREYDERPAITAFDHLRIPLSELAYRIDEIGKNIVIFICQSGLRSKKAIGIVAQRNKGKRLFSLKGGMKAIEKL